MSLTRPMLMRVPAHVNITARPFRPCSFGFVQFESHDSAAAAKEALAGTMIDNRRCDVCRYFSPMNFYVIKMFGVDCLSDPALHQQSQFLVDAM
jgi:hypothetical protein